MKLGVKVKENGTVELCVAATGEEIEGVRAIFVRSGIDCETRAKVELFVYDKDGKHAIG